MKVATYTNGNKTLEIHYDDCPLNPREDWDNMGTMLCAPHRRYSLGDKHSYDIEYLKRIEENAGNKNIVLPLYLYDHSGITMNTTGFSCSWDSGQVGVIFVSRAKARETYGWKVITEKRKQIILESLKAEVETYDQYLKGDVYGFKLFENGEETDSYWGFFGDDHETNGIFDHVGGKFEDWIEQN